MDMVKGNSRKKNQTKKPSRPCSNLLKQASKVTSTCGRKKNKAGRAAPAGCFPVYVGPEKQQFVVKTEIANHPLFKVLLEDAALKYGYKNDGPLLLPCDVDLFCNVLTEIEGSIVEDMICPNSWCLMRGFFGSARPRHLDFRMNKGYGSAYRSL
ncbi:hypothetical protein ACLB2K_051724 [Fragaria x ananassa]